MKFGGWLVVRELALADHRGCGHGVPAFWPLSATCAGFGALNSIACSVPRPNVRNGSFTVIRKQDERTAAFEEPPDNLLGPTWVEAADLLIPTRLPTASLVLS